MKCKVPGCKNSSRFKFPKNDKIKKKWIKLINLPDNFDLSPRSGLCKSHFVDTDFTRTAKDIPYVDIRYRLLPEAVPSIFPWSPKPVIPVIVNTDVRAEEFSRSRPTGRAVGNLKLDQQVGLNIDCLNDKCLIKIFEYLPIKEKLEIELVRSRWNKLSKLSWSKVKYLDIKRQFLEKYLNTETDKEKNTNFVINVLRRCGTYLNYLSIVTHDTNLNFSLLLKKLPEYCNNLVDINLTDMYQNYKSKTVELTDQNLKSLFKNNANIKSLFVKNCKINSMCLLSLSSEKIVELFIYNTVFESDEYFYDFLSKLKNLKTIEIDDCNCNYYKIIRALNKSNCENISEFYLHHSNILKSESADILPSLKELFFKQRNLKHLKLNVFEVDEDFLKGLPSPELLKILNLSFKSIPMCISRFKYLISISCKVKELTDQCVLALTRCINFNLKKVSIDSLNGIENTYFLTEIGESYFIRFQNIESFKFFNQNANLDNVLKYLEKCKNLKYLLVGKVFTDKGVESISTLTNLKLLDINFSSITDNQLEVLIKKLTNLKHLIIDDCEFLSKAMIEKTSKINNTSIKIEFDFDDDIFRFVA